jgi:hypothetical protein
MTRSPPLLLRGRRRRKRRFGRRRGSSAGGRGGLLCMYCVVCADVCRRGSLTSEHCLVLGGAPCSLPCLACVGTNSQPHGIAARLAGAAMQRRVAAQRSAAQATVNAGAARPANGPSGWSTQALAPACARVSQRPVFLLPRRLSIFVPSLHRESCAAHHHAPSSGACPNAVPQRRLLRHARSRARCATRAPRCLCGLALPARQ